MLVAGRIEIGNFKMSWGGVSKKDVGPTFDLKGTDAWRNIVGYNDNFAEETVTEKRAHGLATVYTCINVRARTIASLPINIYREDGDKKESLSDHPVYYPIAHQPNNYMSSANMFLTSMIHSDSWGNSVIGINRDGRMRASTFDIIKPGEWDVQAMDGEAWYKINGELYPSRDVLHFRWFTLDGLNGISPIRQNQITMGRAFRLERFSSMSVGKRIPGFLTFEGTQTDVQKAQNQDSWKHDIDRGRVPVLSGRWDYKQTMLNAADAEYIASSQLTAQEIYGIFQLPPAFAQNYERMTWNNAEQADLVYVKHTVTPICRVIEQELNMKLFTEKEKSNHYVKFNLNGLLRGDSKARAEYYTAMRNIGGLNGNEIRALDDMNPYEGGEIYTIQGANVPIDQLREFYSSKVAPTAGQTEKPRNGTKLNGEFHHVN